MCLSAHNTIWAHVPETATHYLLCFRPTVRMRGQISSAVDTGTVVVARDTEYVPPVLVVFW